MYIRQRVSLLIVAAIAATVAACAGSQPLQTPTPQTLSPSPDAAFSAERRHEFSRRVPGPPRAATQSPLPQGTPGQSLGTPDIVEAVKHSVVQVAVTVPGAPRPNVGTGIVFDRTGHILTNYHVVTRAEMIKVSLSNGELLTAQLFREEPAERPGDYQDRIGLPDAGGVWRLQTRCELVKT